MCLISWPCLECNTSRTVWLNYTMLYLQILTYLQIHNIKYTMPYLLHGMSLMESIGYILMISTLSRHDIGSNV